jgi:MFS family permease
LTSILQPISGNKINNLVESKQRATIISINSMFFSFMMILFFPLTGYIAEGVSLQSSFIIIGLINLIIVNIAGINVRKTYEKEQSVRISD